jgi:hypothetical protein
LTRNDIARASCAARKWIRRALRVFPVSLFLLDAFYPDEINGPRVPPEIVPEVEQFVKDLAKLAGSESAG